MEGLRTYTGVERAAVLMMLVGEDEAAAILQKLDPEEVPARPVGSEALPPIEDAPGSYVRVRA